MGMMDDALSWGADRLKKILSGEQVDSFEDTDEGTIVSMAENEYKRRAEEKRPFDLQMRLNIAFIEGNQYVEINPVTMALDEIPELYWWQEREVFNHIAPTIEVRQAKLSRMRPILKTRPGTGQMEDVRASKIGTQLLKNVYEDENIQEKLSVITAWTESCGSALLKSVWNSNKGSLVAQLAGENGEQVPVREGDLDTIVVPPQEIFPDSCYHQDVDDCRSIIHAKAYHIKDIEDIWGAKVAAEETVAMQMQRAMSGVGGLGYGMGGFRFMATRLKDHAVVKEYWERPSKKYPEGRLIIIAGGKLLHNGPNPYKIGEDNQPDLPFRKVDCIKRVGMFFGKTVVERLIPLQRRYNALRNRKAEFLNRCSIGQWIVEDGACDIDELEQNAGSPSYILVYQRGFSVPKLAENPQLPVAFETELSAILQEISMISGVSELSRQSSADPGVKSGVALSIALEQDDTRLSSSSTNIERFLVSSGKQWLRMYRTMAQGTRLLRSVGSNNLVEIMDWEASELRSDDVVVEGWSALAESPAQRRQMVFDLLAAGLLNDPDTGRIDKDTRAKVFEMIEMGTWETGDDDESLHISKAERENIKLRGGMLENVENYDDHVIHIAKHNSFRLTVDYENLVNENPIIEQIFQAHVDMHLQALALIAQQQMQAAVQMTPQPPEKQTA